MEKDCLVTTLKGSVNNDSLPRLGAIRIQVKSIDAADYSAQTSLKRLILNNTKDFVVETTGDGMFGTSVSELNKNRDTFSAGGDRTIYFSNGNYDVFIYEKYTLTKFSCRGYIDGQKTSLFNFDVQEFDTAYALDYFDVSALWHNVSGNISILPVREMTYCACINTDITGDVSDFVISGTSNFQGTRVYGDFTNIVKYGTSHGQPFKGNTSNPTRDGSLFVDFSQANSVKNYYDHILIQSVTCVWRQTRPSENYILPLSIHSPSYGFDFGDDLDAMLINQANCTNDTNKSTALQTTISVLGNKTSASDAAVATLKGYGYTVIINGETL